MFSLHKLIYHYYFVDKNIKIQLPKNK